MLHAYIQQFSQYYGLAFDTVLVLLSYCYTCHHIQKHSNLCLASTSVLKYKALFHIMLASAAIALRQTELVRKIVNNRLEFLLECESFNIQVVSWFYCCSKLFWYSSTNYVRLTTVCWIPCCFSKIRKVFLISSGIYNAFLHFRLCHCGLPLIYVVQRVNATPNAFRLWQY